MSKFTLGPNGCPIYWPYASECSGYGTCFQGVCSCDTGFTGYSPFVSQYGTNCQNNLTALTTLRILSMIPSVVVFILGCQKLFKISSRECKKEINAYLATMKINIAGPDNTSSSMTSLRGEDKKKRAVSSSTEVSSNGGTTISENEASPEKEKKKIIVSPNTIPSAGYGSPLSFISKIKVFFVKISFIPRGVKKSEPVRLIFFSTFRCVINFLIISFMLASNQNSDYRTPVLVFYAVGQILFWASAAILMYKFIDTNIRSSMMKKATENVPILNRIKWFYILLYVFFVFSAQICMIYIAAIPNGQVTQQLFMYILWSSLSGVNNFFTLSTGVFAVVTTLNIIAKSLNGSTMKTDSPQYQTMVSLQQKNKRLYRILAFAIVPTNLIFFGCAFLPGFTISMDYLIMVLMLLSSAALYSGIKMFN